MRRLLRLVLAMSICGFAAAPRLSVSGNKFVDPNGNEVVLRGISLIEIASANPLAQLNKATDSASGWFARVVRCPINPPGGDNPFPVNGSKSQKDAYVAANLAPLVDAAEAKGVYLIIDWHEIAEVADEDANTKAFWTYMAPLYKDREHVIYEVYNEPKQTPDNWDAFKSGYAQPWVDLIRALAPKTLLLMGGPSWSQVIGGAATNPLSGGNIGYVGHVYANHIGSNWIMNQNIAACSKVHPVFITEWGYNESPIWDPRDSRSGYGQPLKEFIETHRLSWTAWCWHDAWQPKMFSSLTGWQMTDFGQFVQDWLKEKKDLDLPSGGAGPFTLAVTALGPGSVIRSPDLSSYPKGTSVTLVAKPAAGMVFKGWSGGNGTNANPLVLKITANTTLVARFQDSASAANLLVNGDFSEGTTGWSLGQGTGFGGSEAAMEIAGGALKVTVAKAGTATWNVQVQQANLEVQAGRTYRLSFQASSSENREVDIGVSHPTAYTRYVTIKPALTTSLQTFSETFVADSTAPARVDMNLGAVGTGTFTLDNVVLSEVAPTRAMRLEPRTSPRADRLRVDPVHGRVQVQGPTGWVNLTGAR